MIVVDAGMPRAVMIAEATSAEMDGEGARR